MTNREIMDHKIYGLIIKDNGSACKEVKTSEELGKILATAEFRSQIKHYTAIDFHIKDKDIYKRYYLDGYVQYVEDITADQYGNYDPDDMGDEG